MILSKYCANGNDFLIFHTFDSKDLSERVNALCKKLCNRFYGIGSDGLVVLVPYLHDMQGVKSPFLEYSRVDSDIDIIDGLQVLGSHPLTSPTELKSHARKDSKSISYKWRFYNSDGSMARMCGNATRAVGLYAFHNRLATMQHSFLSQAGVVDVAIKQIINEKEALVQSNLGEFVFNGSFIESRRAESKSQDSNIFLSANHMRRQEMQTSLMETVSKSDHSSLKMKSKESKKYSFELIVIGVPHLVHICDSKDVFDELCDDIEFLSYLRHKYDANVSLCFKSENLEILNKTFIKQDENLKGMDLDGQNENLSRKAHNLKEIKENLMPQNRIIYATFERGVEGITQACGTGACAVYVAFRDFDTAYTLMPPSNEELSVCVKDNQVYLTGIVSKVCDCII